jgi:hypothetical protein
LYEIGQTIISAALTICFFTLLLEWKIMDRQALIDSTINKIRQLPELKIKEVNDFADFLLSRIDDKIVQEGIHHMISDSKTFDFLVKEEDLYTVEDLRERYK